MKSGRNLSPIFEFEVEKKCRRSTYSTSFPSCVSVLLSSGDALEAQIASWNFQNYWSQCKVPVTESLKDP